MGVPAWSPPTCGSMRQRRFRRRGGGLHERHERRRAAPRRSPPLGEATRSVAPGGTMTVRRIGEVVLKLDRISLAFGGVKALTDISFDVREHEVRAIIGPNGAGKSSMLNCINGVYQPQQGSITFRGKTFRHMNSRQVAEMGVARTFQNLALVK